MSQIAWGPLIGVIVGFLLGQIANLIAALFSSRKEKKLVRLLMTLEIEHNLALVSDYWNNVSLAPDEGDEEDPPKELEVEADRLARRAVTIPLPVLSNTAFKSQLSALPKALDETAIRSTWRVYEDIAQIQALHAWLLQVSSAPTSGTDRFPSASRAIRSEGLLSGTFQTQKSGAVFDLRKTIQIFLDNGNPLDKVGTAINSAAPR